MAVYGGPGHVSIRAEIVRRNAARSASVGNISEALTLPRTGVVQFNPVGGLLGELSTSFALALIARLTLIFFFADMALPFCGWYSWLVDGEYSIRRN